MRTGNGARVVHRSLKGLRTPCAPRFHLGNELEIYDHPNQERYPGLKISVVLVEGYVYLVPFVENKDEIFLKTIIPSRKATKYYSGESNE